MVVATASKTDPADKTKQRADLALYPTYAAPKGTEQANWSAVEVFIECKPESTQDDPFDDKAVKFLPSSERRRENLGQIMSYASTIFQSQHRKHQFSVVLLGDMARIVRWDRSGVVATEKFNYREEPSKLGRFFWRLCHMSAVQRGHDKTVEEVYTDSIEYKNIMLPRAQTPIVDEATGIELGQHARLLFAESLRTAKMCYKINMHDGQCERSFLVGAPHFLSPELAGRGTRGYVAIDCSNPKGPFVYLKDAWRVDHDGIEPEGNVLKYLNDGEKIEGVPTLVCHGDIKDRMGDQVTDSQEVWKIVHPDRQDCPLKMHRHYRIVVKEVGLSMSRFRNAKELVYLIGLCIQAHALAYDKGVIHRDVSAGNVLICIKEKIVNGRLVRKRIGMLTDWELSKRRKAPETARQPNRTGTWQFMSAYILNHPEMAIQLPDELEAFVHVLLFYAIRFLRHNCENVRRFMQDYFNDFRNDGSDFFCGLAKSKAMAEGTITHAHDDQLIFYCPPRGPAVQLPAGEPPQAGSSSSTLPSHVRPLCETHPINNVFKNLLELLKARYALLKLANPVASMGTTSTSSQPPDVFDEDENAEDESAEDMDAFFFDAKYDPVPSQVQQKKELTAAERKKYEDDADKLTDHTKFITVLSAPFRDPTLVWPKKDKIPDQLRLDIDPKKDKGLTPAPGPVPTNPTTPTTSQVGTRTRSATIRSLNVPPTASGTRGKRFNREDDDDDEYVPRSAKRTAHWTSMPSVPQTGSRRKGKGRA
ncbi:hypothetical protein L227DRAFT_529943 [Lentinus tigrinus ALCF2SS1-6]|uniref:Fungal-type protein kinase domain-containing protein n=1 Tax=Lentinus tigrinus ALCF2SS1-6 TaxID=1328759 RepID=A0A5C2S2R3_9APHY|nr:hypothetical protein L227DRAFT_529943 [Lentinus tigrinus ALCF2SS1-6]